MWIDRLLSGKIVSALGNRPALLLSGARQTGKTSLLRRVLPEASYVSLDNFLLASEAVENPGSFLDSLSLPAIIDEIQYAPNLFRELKIRIDNDRSKYGRWLLTGSQKLQLMSNVSESLAGRIRLLMLETLSAAELRGCGNFSRDDIAAFLCRGGYPELWDNLSIDHGEYLEDYIQTYIERDLKDILDVVNLRLFRRMLQFAALRVGQLVNYAEVGRDTGVSLNTAKNWLLALETSGLVWCLAPFHKNIGKRLAKSPKFYFCDHGLACHLLGVSMDNWGISPYRGAIWENFVLSEIIKTTFAVPGRDIYHYRDQNQVEIDFVYETPKVRFLIEAKASERVDERSLNFSKVAPLFQDKEIKCVLMANIPEDKILRLGGYDIVNPLFVDYFAQDSSS